MELLATPARPRARARRGRVVLCIALAVLSSILPPLMPVCPAQSVRGDSADRGARDAEYRRKILSLIEENAQLKAAILEKDTERRNILLAGGALLILVAVFSARTLRARRREARLRADAAEAEVLRETATNAHRDQEIQQMFTEQLIQSQEQERTRIAHELHDGLSQGLLVIRNRALMGLHGPQEAERLAGHLTTISDLASQAVDDVRSITRALRPAQLERLGLSETLRATLSSVAEASDIRFTFNVDDIDGLVAREHEISVYRIVQEGINNIIKHAHAGEALVLVSRADEHLRIMLEDDGLGFTTTARNGRGAGFGLHGMHERVRMLGGDIDISTSPGGGTAIRIDIPIRPLVHGGAGVPA